MIRVVIAAPSAIVRAGLESLLRAHPGIEIAGSAPDVADLLPLEPDVVLLDPDRLDDEVLQGLLTDASPAVILLSDNVQASWLRSGVRAILPRELTASEIGAAVEAAAAGLVVLHPHDVDELLSGPAQSDGTLREPLTPREIEVLRMLAEGLGNKEIAWRLKISEHTVKFHVGSIMAKLNAASRTEAVTTGIRSGLILL